MTRIAATIKDIYTKEYQLLNEKQRNKYDGESLVLYAECLESLIKFAEQRNLDSEKLVQFEEAVRENIIIEALYANPDDPQKVSSISRTKISQVLKLIFDSAYEDASVDDIYDYIVQNSGTSAKNEFDDILKYLRFIIKHDSIGKKEQTNE